MTESRKFKKGLVISVLVLTIGAILGISIGIALTQKKLENSLIKARQILAKYPLIDGHNDVPSMVRKNFRNQFKLFNFTDLSVIRDQLFGTDGVTHTDILRLKKGLLGAQFWAAYASCESLAKDAVRIHLEQLDMMKRLINKFPNDLKYAENSKGKIYKILPKINVKTILRFNKGI